jgi:hypothetical protein
LKIKDYDKPSYKKQFEIGIGLADSKLSKILSSSSTKNIILGSISTRSRIITGARKDNPVDLIGLGG